MSKQPVTTYACKCKRGYIGDGRQCTGWHHEESKIPLEHNRYSNEDPKGWGKWQKEELCPENTYAYAYALKILPYQGGASDDSGLNGVKLYCKSPTTKLQEGDITSGMGGEGSWTKPKECFKEDSFLTGYQFRAEVSANSADNVFGENLNVKCHKGQTLKGEDFNLENGEWATWGEWSSMKSCRSGSAICGIKTKIYPQQSGGKDDAGLTNIKFMCCKF